MNLKLRIPDTLLVFAGKNQQGPLWLYTDRSGNVCKCKDFDMKQIMQRLGSREYASDVSAIQKVPEVRELMALNGVENSCQTMGNICTLVNSNALHGILDNVAAQAITSPLILQRFVKCRGSKPFIIRTCLRANASPISWMIVSRKSFPRMQNDKTEIDNFIASTQDSVMGKTSKDKKVYTSDVCNVCVLSQSAGRDTVALTKKIMDYLESTWRIPFETLVCDFTRDANGFYWFLQVKAYRLQNGAIYAPNQRTSSNQHRLRKSPIKSMSKRNYQMTKLHRCAFTQIDFESSSLLYSMTGRMMFDCVTNLRRRLSMEKLRLLVPDSLLSRYPGSEKAIQYQPLRVCTEVYELYHTLSRLERVEALYERFFERADDDYRLSEQYVNNRQSTVASVRAELPPQIKAGTNLTMYRFMIAFHSLHEIPESFCESIAATEYFLVYHVFGVEHVVPLKFENPGAQQLRTLRIFTFFVPSASVEQSFSNFLIKQRAINVDLVCRCMGDTKRLGTAHLPLLVFKSAFVKKYDLFAPFGKECQKCSLRASVGFEKSRFTSDLSSLKQLTDMQHFMGEIVVPDDSFSIPTALPEEWMESLRQSANFAKRERVLSTESMYEMEFDDEDSSDTKVAEESTVQETKDESHRPVDETQPSWCISFLPVRVQNLPVTAKQLLSQNNCTCELHYSMATEKKRDRVKLYGEIQNDGQCINFPRNEQRHYFRGDFESLSAHFKKISPLSVTIDLLRPSLGRHFWILLCDIFSAVDTDSANCVVGTKLQRALSPVASSKNAKVYKIIKDFETSRPQESLSVTSLTHDLMLVLYDALCLYLYPSGASSNTLSRRASPICLTIGLREFCRIGFRALRLWYIFNYCLVRSGEYQQIDENEELKIKKSVLIKELLEGQCDPLGSLESILNDEYTSGDQSRMIGLDLFDVAARIKAFGTGSAQDVMNEGKEDSDEKVAVEDHDGIVSWASFLEVCLRLEGETDLLDESYDSKFLPLDIDGKRFTTLIDINALLDESFVDGTFTLLEGKTEMTTSEKLMVHYEEESKSIDDGDCDVKTILDCMTNAVVTVEDNENNSFQFPSYLSATLQLIKV
eukprot:g2119.t1